MLDHKIARLALEARLLTQAGLPAAQAWVNEDFKPAPGTPYVRVEYLPGPAFQATLGPLGEMEYRPQLIVSFFAPTGTGAETLDDFAAATIVLFPPRQALTLSTGDTLRVSDDPAPYRGQVLRDGGWAMVQVTIPLWARSSNTI